MRIVFSTFGSLGDVHPMMALARELQARGHEAIIATSELYRTKIQAEGIGFHALRPNLLPPEESRELIAKVMDARTGSEYLFREILMPALRDSFDDLCEVARTADVLISHPAVPAAPLVGEALKMKWMSVALAPISLWSIYDPPVLAPLPVLAKWRGGNASLPVQRAVKRLASRITSRWVAPVLELRQELGLERRANLIFEGQYSPHGVLALFSKVLAQPQPDWPRNTHQCGFCFYDKRGQVGDLLVESLDEQRQWIASGEPPIVFTLGSSAVFDARNFYEESTIAARQLGRRALLLIGE
jgi:UDP:flavonoid glycosyltransferase YjiC (YdhE family)